MPAFSGLILMKISTAPVAVEIAPASTNERTMPLQNKALPITSPPARHRAKSLIFVSVSTPGTRERRIQPTT